MLNFVICDDNAIILEKLSKMLESILMKYKTESRIAYTCTTANALMKYMKENPVDVLILDIKLDSNISGLKLANEIRKTNKNIYLIFTTGHLEYALLAYQVKTFDYIPKPITIERLEQTMNRLFEDIQTDSQKFIPVGNTKILVNEDDIYYIKKDGMKLIYHATDRDYETYLSFSRVLPTLPNTFVRCHKSYIINLNTVSNVDLQKNLIHFKNNESCAICPKFKNNFMEVFNNYGNFKYNMECLDTAQ